MIINSTLFYKALSPFFKPTVSLISKKIVGSEILSRREWLRSALEPILTVAINEIAEDIEKIGTAEIGVQLN